MPIGVAPKKTITFYNNVKFEPYVAIIIATIAYLIILLCSH